MEIVQSLIALKLYLLLKRNNIEKMFFQNIESLPENKLLEHDYFGSINKIDAYEEDVSIYIAGFIAMKIFKKTSCEHCKTFLL